LTVSEFERRGYEEWKGGVGIYEQVGSELEKGLLERVLCEEETFNKSLSFVV